MTIDIKNCYLGTPLDHYEYVKITVSMVPNSIMEEYNVYDLVQNGYMYVEVRKGMHGLPQAGLHANILLAKQPMKFSLVEDDF
jgi:hypothetical protein